MKYAFLALALTSASLASCDKFEFPRAVTAAPAGTATAPAATVDPSSPSYIAPEELIETPSVRYATPEDAVRAFLHAIITHDKEELKTAIRPTGKLDEILGAPQSEALQKTNLFLLNNAKFRRLKAGETIKIKFDRLERNFHIDPDMLNENCALIWANQVGILQTAFPFWVHRINGSWRVGNRVAPLLMEKIEEYKVMKQDILGLKEELQKKIQSPSHKKEP